MAQDDYTVANAAGATVRADINSQLAAIVSQNSGAAAPATTFAEQIWYDSTNDILKQRNSANSAWIDLIHFDQTNGLFRIDLDKGADIASAATTDIWAATGNTATITGAVTITSLGSGKAGSWRLIRFAAALLLTHNPTSLILPGGASITTAAGDMALVLSEGSSNARVAFYQPATARPGGQWELIGTATASGSPTIDFTWARLYRMVLAILTGVAPATNGVALNLLTTTDGGSTWDAGASDYAYFRSVINLAAAPTETFFGDNAEAFVSITPSIGNGSNQHYTGTVEVLASDVAQYTTIRHRGFVTTGGGVLQQQNGTGVRLSAADVDGMRFQLNSGNISSGEFAVYGLV